MTAVAEVVPGVYDIDAGTTCRIDIGQGYAASIDVADKELIAPYPWRLLRGHNGKLYAYAQTASGPVYMHRLIARTPVGRETDHINGDGLDNRRSNLRIATCGQNSANMWKPRRPDGTAHSSHFKGVSWDRSRGKWQSKITIDRRCKNLGRYDSEEAAARAYDAAATAAWGPFARLNFPKANEVAA